MYAHVVIAKPTLIFITTAIYIYIFHLVDLHYRARGDITRLISLVALRGGIYIYAPFSRLLETAWLQQALL